MGKIPNKYNLVGRKFGRLTVLKYYRTDPQGCRLWLCKCDCGKTSTPRTNALISGISKACGCGKFTHNMSYSRIYMTWRSMMARCYRKKNSSYKNYGGRGIVVLEKWHSFENFLEWSKASGYKNTLTIDRIKNEKGYNPSNCRWATKLEQANNCRTNRKITFKGKTLTLAQWSRQTGVRSNTISNRLASGWSVERTLSLPLVRGRRHEA